MQLNRAPDLEEDEGEKDGEEGRREDYGEGVAEGQECQAPWERVVMGYYYTPVRGTIEIMRTEGHIMPTEGRILQPKGSIMWPEGCIISICPRAGVW